MLWVRISIRARCTTLCDKVCQWLVTGRWFSPGPPVSSTNKTEILLKGALNTIKQTNKYNILLNFLIYAIYKNQTYSELSHLYYIYKKSKVRKINTMLKWLITNFFSNYEKLYALLWIIWQIQLSFYWGKNSSLLIIIENQISEEILRCPCI